MFKFQTNFEIIIACGCGGYFNAFDNLEKEVYQKEYNQEYKCDKCNQIIKVQLGWIHRERDPMGNDSRVFHTLSTKKEDV